MNRLKENINKLELKLNGISNIISVVGIMLTVGALLLSIYELKEANKKADLNLKYNVYLTSGYIDGKYSKNGDGKIIFLKKMILNVMLRKIIQEKKIMKRYQRIDLGVN